MARQNVDTHQEGYVPTTIKAAQLAQLKAKRDTTIIGSTVSGKKVEVDTGHDLHMQSLQDVDNFKEHSKSAGFSVSSKPNFKDPTGSISASVGSKGKASSTTQSAISDGILTVDGKEIDTKTININTENTLHQLDKIFDKKKIEERQELARLFAKNAFEEVHRLSDKYHWKEGGPEKVALHAAIGEITAQLAGNPNGSGAVAAGINELAIKKIIDKVGKDHPDQAQILSAVLGATVNKVLNKNIDSGASISSFATKYNVGMVAPVAVFTFEEASAIIASGAVVFSLSDGYYLIKDNQVLGKISDNIAARFDKWGESATDQLVFDILSNPESYSSYEVKWAQDLYEAKRTRQSEKEKASDVPSWAEGVSPREGESGRDFADRVYREKGKEIPVNKGPGSDWNKLKKHGDRKVR